ncbi:unnamed protein product [Nesidiocoris tenuis]|uniref:RanBD1 domain-containing protein n=1 Tax=Nesidiocoris tenuis TaxID=355587 RepID=A0A6H5GQ70_9HEMI|nr:unnamed protein product [Nesidiocoris tenuis]
MKLCLNHYITDEIEMKSQDDKSWLWVATDFALGEPSVEKFAIRFKNNEIATGFYEAFEKAKKLSDPPPQTVPAVTSSSTASFKSDSDDGMRSLTLYESNNVIPTVSLSVTLTWQDDNHSISEPHNAKNKSRKKAQIDLSRITTDNFFKILLRPFCLCVWYEWSDQRYFFSRIFYPMGIGKSTSLAEFVTRLRNMLNAIPCRTLRELLDDDDDAAAVDAANSTVSSVYQPATPFWSAQAKAAEPAKSLESADKPKEPVTSTEQPTSVFGGSASLFGTPATTFSFSNVTYSFGQKSTPTTTQPLTVLSMERPLCAALSPLGGPVVMERVPLSDVIVTAGHAHRRLKLQGQQIQLTNLLGREGPFPSFRSFCARESKISPGKEPVVPCSGTSPTRQLQLQKTPQLPPSRRRQTGKPALTIQKMTQNARRQFTSNPSSLCRTSSNYQPAKRMKKLVSLFQVNGGLIENKNYGDFRAEREILRSHLTGPLKVGVILILTMSPVQGAIFQSDFLRFSAQTLE